MTLHSLIALNEEKHLSREVIIKNNVQNNIIEMKMHVLKLKKNTAGEIVSFETYKFEREESGVIYHDCRLELHIDETGSVRLMEI